MSKLCEFLIIIQMILILWPKFTRSTLAANSSFISRRNSDLFSGASDVIDRQYPTDVTFILPHLIVGLLIPIAVIIGIGVVLMKLFIVGFWLLGKGGLGGLGGYGFGQVSPYGYPWRVDQFHQQKERSLLGRDGAQVPSHLSSTMWQLIEKVSRSLEKFDKYKN